MELQTHGKRYSPAFTLLASSAGLRSTIPRARFMVCERRRSFHNTWKLPGCAGSEVGLVRRTGAGVARGAADTGAIW